MKKKISEFLIVMLLISFAIAPAHGTFDKSICSAQFCEVEWAKTYGGDEFDMFHCIHQTHDDGFIVSGVSEQSDKYYPILMKLDSDGDEEWTWTAQQVTYRNVVYDIQDAYPIFSNQVNDGGYLLCLWLDILYAEDVVTIAGLFKINEYGDQEWITYYSEGFEWGFRPISFIELEDSYVVAGTSGPPTSYMGDEAGLLKTDKMGSEQWYKEYDFGDADNSDNRMEAVCRTSDGGYILTGWGSDTSYDYWMIKTDEVGNLVWEKTFGGSRDDYGHTKDCYQTRDGGYVTGGFSSSFGAGRSDMWVIKTDSAGNMVWNKTYGGTQNDVCWGLESTDDDGYVAVVTMNYGGFSGDKDDIHLIKLADDGTILWVQEYGGPGIQIGASVDKTSDGGFVVAGFNGMFYSHNSDGLIVKFAPFDNQRPDKPTRPSGSERGKTGNQYTYTTSATDADGDQIYYLWDWGDGNYSDTLGPYGSGETCEATYAWTLDGSYSIRVMAMDEHGGESDWSDPLPITMPKTHENPLWTLIDRLFDWLEQVFTREILLGIFNF